eukprot:3498826-Rhodomonas_salina.7
MCIEALSASGTGRVYTATSLTQDTPSRPDVSLSDPPVLPRTGMHSFLINSRIAPGELYSSGLIFAAPCQDTYVAAVVHQHQPRRIEATHPSPAQPPHLPTLPRSP